MQKWEIKDLVKGRKYFLEYYLQVFLTSCDTAAVAKDGRSKQNETK